MVLNYLHACGRGGLADIPGSVGVSDIWPRFSSRITSYPMGIFTRICWRRRWSRRGIFGFVHSLELTRIEEAAGGSLCFMVAGLLLRMGVTLVSNMVSIWHFLIGSRTVESFKSLQLICVMGYGDRRGRSCGGKYSHG
jgi:hypothetical protein